VTVPHKEAALAYVDDVTDDARRVGAVNTIRVEADRMVGHNTDTTGMLDALARDGGLVIHGQRAVVVGAGGAARAAVFALAGAGATAVTILNRNWDRAAALADAVRRAFRCTVDAVPLDGTAAASALHGATLLVQATTIGGGAQRALSPVPRAALHPGLFVMDMIYDPEETALLREARGAGCRTLGGLPMLVYQGARAFEIWTGRAAPLGVMRDAVGLPGEPASTA
jgi:shikimate dehydrogenase